MRYLFFSGKGGVGKTSLACATAVALAEAGRRTLIVTTDPASNLADVFEQEIGPAPRAVVSVPGLDAQEIDAEAAARAYRERTLAPLVGLLPKATIEAIEEQMSGPCTVEIAGFDEFVASMFRDDYDVIVFDTAPTGHTLRLLELPSAWSHHITEASAGTGMTCIGPVEQLATAKSQYDVAMDRLRDARTTNVLFVTRPDRLSAAETLRAAKELRDLGISHQELVINAVMPEDAAQHPFFRDRRALEQEVIQDLRREFPGAIHEVPLLGEEIKGIGMLRTLGRWVDLDALAVP
jgi:arsenite-transporting ATPase